MSRRSTGIALGLLGFALLLRGAALDRDRVYTGDEEMHVQNAYAYAEHGHLGPDHWYHPPLKHLLTYATIRTAGDDPWGWRLRNAIFGAATVAVLFVLGEALLGSSVAAATAALALAVDPLHVTFSRSTFEDVPATFFALVGLLFALRRHRTGSARALVAAGAALGLAVALRTYFAVLLVAVAAALAAVELRRGRPSRLLGIAAALGLVPLAIYLAPFAPWFRRGYGLGEWLTLQRWALVEASAAAGVEFNRVVMTVAGPWRWFLAPVGIALVPPGGERRVVLVANDLPVWILVLPALVAAAVWAVRERRWELGALPVAFLLLYLPFLLAGRPIFLYSSLCLLPFAFLAVGHGAERLLRRWTPGFAALLLAWGLYLYPLAAGAPVDLARYAPVLRWVRIVGQW